MYELTRAEQLFQQNRHAESANMIRSYLGVHPNDADAKYLLILNLIELAHLEEAEHELHLAISEDPDRSNLFMRWRCWSLKRKLPINPKQPLSAR